MTVSQRETERHKNRERQIERAKDFANNKDVHMEVVSCPTRLIIIFHHPHNKEILHSNVLTWRWLAIFLCSNLILMIQDFDICYGSKELILDADFTLEQGRR